MYRKNSLKLDDFIYTINHFLSQIENNIQLILGDFNYNAFKEDSSREKLSEVLTDYNQIVDQPTHISGSLIDHVYIKKAFQNQIDMHSIVKNIHFSDHDAVKLCMSNLKL